MRQFTDHVKIIGHERLADTIAHEFRAYSLIPAPSIYSRKRELRQLLSADEAIKRTTHEPTVTTLCILRITNKHHIIIARPQSRQETKISPELTPCMRRREIRQIRSESQVVFRIKNVQFHHSGGKGKKKIALSCTKICLSRFFPLLLHII
jgi:hypothetical protein